MKNIFVAMILVFMGLNAYANTLEMVTKADCYSATTSGSYLKLDLKAETLEARIVNLPVLTNLAEEERMPVEIQQEDNYTMILSLAHDPKTGIWGSIGLATGKGEELQDESEIIAVYRDATGGVVQEPLICRLEF